VNMAHGLALYGKKVLLIDTDPQGSASHHLGVRTSVTLYDLLIRGLTPEDCIVEARPNLDIICANEHLFPAEMKLTREPDREYILSDKLEGLDGYDIVLLDCAPSMNLLNQNALLYSDEILLPVSMEYLSLIGVKQLLKNIKIVNKLFDKDIKITRVIPTFYDRRNKKSQDILDSLNRVFPGHISSPVRSSVSLSEAPGVKKSIFEYDPNSNAAEDYKALIKEVLSCGKEKRL